MGRLSTVGVIPSARHQKLTITEGSEDTMFDLATSSLKTRDRHSNDSTLHIQLTSQRDIDQSTRVHSMPVKDHAVSR
jgi:hypothetical protein